MEAIGGQSVGARKGLAGFFFTNVDSEETVEAFARQLLAGANTTGDGFSVSVDPEDITIFKIPGTETA